VVAAYCDKENNADKDYSQSVVQVPSEHAEINDTTARPRSGWEAVDAPAQCVTMPIDSSAILSWRVKMSKKVTRSRPWTKEELRILKTLTREKAKIVIARKLKRSVDAMYGLATRLGVMKPQPRQGG
jgi:hypothetical protein